MSQGLKPILWLSLGVRAKARTYLRSKNRSRFPAGMTTRKARAEVEVDSLLFDCAQDEWQKEKATAKLEV